MKSTIFVFAALLALSALVGCKKTKKSYTTPSVTAEIKEEFKEIRSLRRHGKLGKAAQVAIALGNKIHSQYPESTMYREHVLKFLSYSMRVSRLCRDKELELRNESTRPEESNTYKDYAEKIEKNGVAIRAKLKTIPWMVAPKPKKIEKPKEDEKKEGDEKKEKSDKE